MKAIVAIVLAALCAYGAMGMSSAKEAKSTVQKSLDRMQAVEACLN
jgi:hypothetical protein